MIIATFPTYTQVLPGFEQAIGGLRDNLLPLMSVLMICSLVGVAKEGYRAILFHLILLTILVGLAANWQPWFQKASTAVTTTFTGDQYDLSKQTERYLIRLQIKAEQKDSDEGYVEAFFRAIMAGALLLLGYITKGIVLLFLVLQKILLTFAYALSPIFVGFFALRSTRGIAINYLMTTVGLVSWPLGFALSACGTYGLVQFFGNLGYFSVAGNLLTLNEAFFALLIIAVWLLVSTIISPVIISKVMAIGAQAGSALLSGVANTVAAATGAAVTGGASLAGGAAVAGAGGAAAAGGAGGSAPAASGSSAASGGSAGVSAALRTAIGAALGGGASLADAAMSGGNGHGAMSGAVASIFRGGRAGRSAGSSSAKGGSQTPGAKNAKSSQPNTANPPPTAPAPSGSGGPDSPAPLPPPPPDPASVGAATPATQNAAPPPAPASATAPGGAEPSSAGTPIVAPPQTPNNPVASGGSSSAPAPTPAPVSRSGGGGTTSPGGAASSPGRPPAGTRASAPLVAGGQDTSLDGEVSRIIDIATGKPLSGDSLPKPGN